MMAVIVIVIRNTFSNNKLFWFYYELLLHFIVKFIIQNYTSDRQDFITRNNTRDRWKNNNVLFTNVWSLNSEVIISCQPSGECSKMQQVWILLYELSDLHCVSLQIMYDYHDLLHFVIDGNQLPTYYNYTQIVSFTVLLSVKEWNCLIFL